MAVTLPQSLWQLQISFHILTNSGVHESRITSIISDLPSLSSTHLMLETLILKFLRFYCQIHQPTGLTSSLFFRFVVNIFKFFDLRTIIKSVLEFQFLIHYHFKHQQSFLKSMCSLKLVSNKSYRVWISLPGSLVCIYNSISFLKFLVSHFCDD